MWYGVKCNVSDPAVLHSNRVMFFLNPSNLSLQDRFVNIKDSALLFLLSLNSLYRKSRRGQHRGEVLKTQVHY